jgi:uncharacterized protein
MENNDMTLDFGNHPIAIKALVGSWASNLQTPASDKDWKYFVTPTFDDLYSGKMFSQAEVSNTLDYDCHDIRKLGELVWKANINFIITLFSPVYECNPMLQWVFDNADRYATMNLPAFYNSTINMHVEKMKKLLEPTGNTQILVDKFGYDTKQATHALRCLYILNRIANHGMSVRQAFWFEGKDRNVLLGVKAGNQSLDEFREYIGLYRSMHDNSIRNWFFQQTANEELSVELNSGIKQFIRINL